VRGPRLDVDLPRRPSAVQTRHRPSVRWGRSDSGAPRATGASVAATAWPGGAPSSHTSVDLWCRRQHSTGTTPQPPVAPGWFSPAVAGQHARHILSPRRPRHKRGRVPPTTGVGTDDRRRHSPPSPKRPGRPRRRRASASAAPAAVWSQRSAPLVSLRARIVSYRWSIL
jgi:hypothetical protein